MIRYSSLLLVLIFQTYCNETLLQTLNHFKYDVSYQTVKVQRCLNELASYDKPLALSYLDGANTQRMKEHIKKHLLTIAIHVPLTVVYPCISYTKDAIIALMENKACTSLIDSQCPEIFHIDNELYWYFLRDDGAHLRNAITLIVSAINFYKYYKTLTKHNVLYRSTESILISMRTQIENLNIKYRLTALPDTYRSLLIAHKHIHNHNFDNVWLKEVRKSIEELNTYDHPQALECVDIIKNNLEQDRRNRLYFSAGLIGFIMIVSYAQALLSFLNNEDSYTYNRHIQDGHYYNLYVMAPLSPFLFYIFSHESVAPINHKLNVLARFKESLNQ